MMRWPSLNLTLQTRILLLTGFISASLLAATAWLTAVNSAQKVEGAMAERVVQALERLTAHLEEVPPGTLPTGLQLQVRDLLELEPAIKRVDVFAQLEGQIVLIASSSVRSERVPLADEALALERREVRSFVVEDGDFRQLMTVYPFAFVDGRLGFMTVISSLEIVDTILATHSRIGLILTAFTILLLVGGIALVFRTTVYRHIEHLVGVMAGFQGGEGGSRASVDLPGEFRLLAEQLNSMLAEIQQLHGHMHERIVEATAELENRNRELQQLNLQLYDSQRKLSQAERLAVAGQLTAAFAHDIGSPLGAVSTHLQLLLEQKDLPPEAERRLKLATEQIDRVCGIVDSLLSTTRLRPSRAAVDLKELVSRVELLLTPTLEHREIRMKVSAPPESCLVEGDGDQLQQLFLNLMNNAIDAIDRVGKISLELSIPEPGEPDSQPMIQVEVEDSGIGIPEQDLRAIFEPFFTNKGQGQGTGLGLAISREIVKQHRGQISVRSQTGRGTCFTILLPRARGE